MVAAAGGVAAAGAFAPVDVPPLAVLGAAAGLWSAARAGSAAAGAWCGLLWGLGFCGTLFSWTTVLSPAAYVALVPVQAVFWAPIGAAAAVAWPQRPGPWVLTVTAVWTSVEFVRSRWPLGGFEWGQLGLAAADLPVRHAAALIGTLGVTAVAVGVSAGVAAALLHLRGPRRSKALLALLASVGMATLLTVLGAVSWTSPAGSLDVAVVQVDDPCPDEFAVDCPNLRERLQTSFVEGTAAVNRDVDLILWGESALSGETAAAAGRELMREAGTLPAPLLAGTTLPAGSGRFYNRNVLYSADGAVLDAYDKRHPVPFGEYVPLRDLLGGVADVGRLVPSDMVAGDVPGQLSLPTADGVVPVGTVVSWEVTFSRLVRDASVGSELIAVLTTEASYGTAPVSDQLLGAAQLRAAELQKPAVVAATTGRSSIVLPGGERAGTTALFAADLLTGEVPLRAGLTPYARWGETPVAILAFGGALAAAAVAVRHRRGVAAPEVGAG